MIPAWLGTVLDIVRELARRIPRRETHISTTVEDKVEILPPPKEPK